MGSLARGEVNYSCAGILQGSRGQTGWGGEEAWGGGSGSEALPASSWLLFLESGFRRGAKCRSEAQNFWAMAVAAVYVVPSL